MQQGARHIVVEAHLDLTSLKLVDVTDDVAIPAYLLGIVRDTTRSITVRFWHRSSASPLAGAVVNVIVRAMFWPHLDTDGFA